MPQLSPVNFFSSAVSWRPWVHGPCSLFCSTAWRSAFCSYFSTRCTPQKTALGSRTGPRWCWTWWNRGHSWRKRTSRSPDPPVTPALGRNQSMVGYLCSRLDTEMTVIDCARETEENVNVTEYYQNQKLQSEGDVLLHRLASCSASTYYMYIYILGCGPNHLKGSNQTMAVELTELDMLLYPWRIYIFKTTCSYLSHISLRQSSTIIRSIRKIPVCVYIMYFYGAPQRKRTSTWAAVGDHSTGIWGDFNVLIDMIAYIPVHTHPITVCYTSLSSQAVCVVYHCRVPTTPIVQSCPHIPQPLLVRLAGVSVWDQCSL